MPDHSDHSEHFSRAELQCHCGCGKALMDAKFLAKLEELRVAYGKPMTVTSGYRCPAYNSKIAHTGINGPHTTGQAIDIQICGEEAYQLLLLAMQFGFSGLGIGQRGLIDGRFMHLDNLSCPDYPRPRVWTY